MTVPKYDDLINPLLKAMHSLGGSASVYEQESAVASMLKLSDADLSEIQSGNRTKFSYRLAWARNYLKHFGYLTNSSRGVWALTPEGQKNDSVDKQQVKKFVKTMSKGEGNGGELSFFGAGFSEEVEQKWEDELLDTLKKMPADAFERLSQRLLRESGFIQVEVTGRSGDGGIDGRGVLKIAGLITFRVLFQCKRFKGSVSPSIVRDFRGAMQGRADKGIIITTGVFTPDAKAEAQRDGVNSIDLIDGKELVSKLKELRIGVEVKQEVVEDVRIDQEYFLGL